MRRSWTEVTILLTLAALVTGCVTVGHRAVRSSRTDYNVALRQTEDEQLLLNLVRLRYRDRPFFLEATALNTQFSFAPSASAAIDLAPDAEVDSTYGLSGAIAWEETPTVTYVPLQGADYVRRVMSPVSVETMVLLDTSGWSTERVFRICVQRMNGLDNASRAAGPTPAEAPDFEEFLAATRLLRSLELGGGVSGATERIGDDEAVVLRFRPSSTGTAAYRELTRLLRLEPGKKRYRLTAGPDDGGPDRITVEPRSFIGVLYFLSQAVEVPATDIEAGRVTITRDAGGNPFDWGRVTEGLLRVRSSERRPDSAAVAVRYRDSWFYIDDSDLDSKSTFTLLAQLFALQAGGSTGWRPVLTLPVGG